MTAVEKSIKNKIYFSINGQDSFAQFYAMIFLLFIYFDFEGKYFPKQ